MSSVFTNIIVVIVSYSFFIYSGMLYILFREDMRIRLNFIFPMTGKSYGQFKVVLGILALWGTWEIWGVLSSAPFILYPLYVWRKGGYIKGYLEGDNWRDYF